MKISVHTPQHTEKPSRVDQPKKQSHRTQGRKRVRETEGAYKQQKRPRKLFRVQRKPMTMQQQGRYAQHLKALQLQALRDWPGFTSKLAGMASDAQKLILQHVVQCEHLYPSWMKERFKMLKGKLQSLGEQKPGSQELETDSSVVQKLIAYEHRLDSLLTLFAICRKFDRQKRQPG